jgi:uncharacterized protein YjbI with pentapeptide repeats
MMSSKFEGNEEHLKLLKQGAEVWNQWRTKNPDIQPDLRGAGLRGAGLRGADLRGADLGGADLSWANLTGAHLGGAHLGGAHLGGAHLGGADFARADLSEADLSEADLSEVDLSRAELSGARLIRARLSGADLRWAYFREADLRGAHLSEADLRWADLSGADLRWADFDRADLSGADLSGADLSEAMVRFTSFGDLDLSTAKGLDKVTHRRPSIVGIDTIYKSHGQIPEAFLRGCGVPDNFIAYMGSLTGKAFEYYSCFISYSTKDQAFAERLHNDLQGKGVRCWFAPEDIAGGKKLYEQIDQAIRLHDKLLLVLSEHSISSQWVMTEIRRTRKAELRDGQQKLFPIRLVGMTALKEWECFDADTGKDLAVEVREYHIPDFSTWKDHDTYQRAFDRLLRDLKAEAG